MTKNDVLKLVSLNIEGSRHIERFPLMVRKESPDILCLQEVCAYDLERIATACALPYYYYQRKVTLPKEHPIVHEDTDWGIALFASHPVHNVHTFFYRHGDAQYKQMDYTTLTHDQRQRAQEGVVLMGTYQKGDVQFPIATIHFTWSLVRASALQIEDAHRLMEQVHAIPEIILCGDFNVPRIQNTCYDIFTETLIDAIPPHITNSVDRTLHKNGTKITEDLMVDYLFHTPQFHTMNVRLVDGVSDHAAVVAEIYRTV